MTLVVAVALVLGAVLLWPPARPSPPRSPSLRAGGEGNRAKDPGVPGPATVDAAADALVLVALALRSGLAPVEALEAVADMVPGPVGHQLRVVASAHRWGQDAATAWSYVDQAWRPAALAWVAAERSGAAPGGVVLAAAGRMRRQEASRVEAAVQRAGVLLVLPLGLCFLPGFAATTVVPVVLHLARSALSAG
ncbi:type II secretion system F family protein [Knoellia sp. CPCC 206435]|uniref:type II secretion system F family protein n=1 Tax=Knoellia terrae TaxID=3404797 RepID=UPI003B42B517